MLVSGHARFYEQLRICLLRWAAAPSAMERFSLHGTGVQQLGLGVAFGHAAHSRVAKWQEGHPLRRRWQPHDVTLPFASAFGSVPTCGLGFGATHGLLGTVLPTFSSCVG